MSRVKVTVRKDNPLTARERADDAKADFIASNICEALKCRNKEKIMQMWQLTDNPRDSLFHYLKKFVQYVFHNANNDDDQQASIIEILELLISYGIDVDTKNSGGQTMLYLAFENRMSNVVDYLISQNATVCIRDSNGNTIMHYIIEKDNASSETSIIKRIKYLLYCGLNVNAQNKEGSTALDFAIRKQMVQVVNDLITRDANVTIRDLQGNTTVHIAIESSTVGTQTKVIEIVSLLLDSGVDVNAQNTKGYTALFFAIANRLTEVIEFLISRNANWEICDLLGNSIVHFSIICESSNPSNKKDDFIGWILAKMECDVDLKNQNGNTALHLAVKLKLLHVIPILLEYTKDVSVCNEQGMTAFQFFIVSITRNPIKNYKPTFVEEVCEKFLEKGFLVDVTDNNDNTPLHYTLHARQRNIAKLILKYSKNVDARDEKRNTALNIIASYSKVKSDKNEKDDDELVEILLSKGACINKFNQSNLSPIINAVVNQKLNILKKFAAFGENLSRRNYGKTLIHYLLTSTVQTDIQTQLDILNLLIDEGCDINDKDHNGIAPIHLACQYGKTEIVKRLIECEADVNIQHQGCSPLHKAIQHKRDKIVNILLKNGADVNAYDDKGMSSLHLAFKLGKTEIVNSLIEYGADVKNQQSLHGYNLLIEAIIHKHDEIVILLVENGVDVNVKNDVGMTPLHLACKSGMYEIVNSLIQYGAEVNSQEACHGYTPLHTSVQHNQVDLLELLVTNGANVNARTYMGQTALHLRCKENVVVKLIELGANIYIMDKHDLLPLQTAIQQQKSQAIYELLQYGADINDNVHALRKKDYSSAADCLSEHLVKLNIAQLPVDEKLNDAIPLDIEPGQFHEDCLVEIGRLKSYKIDKLVSLYDFLHMDRNKTYNFVKNEKLQRLMMSSKFEKQYPMYHVLLSSTYYKAIQRRDMYEQAKCAWNELSVIELPDLCTYEIFSYVCNVTLRSLIDAVIDKNDEDNEDTSIILYYP